MAKNKLTNHIKAAQQWLNQAESSYEASKEVRGELNVMLAQAELQRAQEKQGRVIKISEKCLVRCLSVVLIAGGFIWFGHNQNSYDASVTSNIIPESSYVNNAEVVKPEINEQAAANAVPQEQTTSVTAQHTPVVDGAERVSAKRATAPTAVMKNDVEQSESIAAEEQLGQAQLQQLIHQAGNSLKGQK